MTRRNLKLGQWRERGLNRNGFALLAYVGSLVGLAALIAARAVFAG